MAKQNRKLERRRKDVEKLKKKMAILPPLSYEQTTEMIKLMKR